MLKLQSLLASGAACSWIGIDVLLETVSLTEAVSPTAVFLLIYLELGVLRRFYR